jgi:Domain of unknown function (DU1801)
MENAVDRYLASLPEDRRLALEQVRSTIVSSLPAGYEESFNWGMPTYEVPLATYPDTYNGKPLMYAAFASQKRYMTVHLMGVDAASDAGRSFREEYEERVGKPPNMGVGCLRFRRLEELPLDLLGTQIASTGVDEFVERVRSARSTPR